MHRGQALCQGVPRGHRDVARNREPEQSIKQIAADFGIAESRLRNWMHQADVEDGRRSASSSVARARGPARRRTAACARSLTTRAGFVTGSRPMPRTSCGWPTSSIGRGRQAVPLRGQGCLLNRIVGYSIDSRMKSRIAVNTLNNAVARRGEVAGRILHTDRGSRS